MFTKDEMLGKLISLGHNAIQPFRERSLAFSVDLVQETA